MIKKIFFLIFLIFNNIDFQYVPLLSRLNKILTSIRMCLLRLAGASIGKNSTLRPKTTIFNPKNLIIGNNTNIGRNSIIMNFDKVIIKDNIEIGPNCTFQANEHLIEDYSKPLGKQGSFYGPISIGSNSYIGSEVTFLQGVSICDGCLIAAKSLVNNDCDKPGLYAGIPVSLKKLF